MPEPKTLSHDESCKTRLASNTDLLLVTLSKDIESVRDCHERTSGASTTGWRSLSSLYQDCILAISPTLNFLMGGCIIFSVESVANDHSSNFEIYTENLYRFSMFDSQYLEQKYRRQCFFFGYPGGDIEREQAM